MWYSFVSYLHSGLIMTQAQHKAEKDTSVNPPPVSASEPCECSEPNLESVLRDRLQEIAGDEVQDLARSILRHLTSATGASPSVSSPEVRFHSAFILNVPVLMTVLKVNTYLTQPDEGANLSRSHALKRATAEPATAS